MSLKQRKIKFEPRIKLSHNISKTTSKTKYNITDKATYEIEEENRVKFQKNENDQSITWLD